MELIGERELNACKLDASSRVLVAFSGGADSTALLLSLYGLYKEGRLGALLAAHYEHGIRGEASLRDLAFCRALCEKLGIPFVFAQGDVPSYAAERGCSLEQGARELRYGFLYEQAEKQGADAIATAHHALDQAETVLLHLIRGSGLTGLCGIYPRRGLLVRPLLERSKEQILRYLSIQGQDYCIDETNLQPDTRRNALRLQLMPQLEALSPGAQERIAKGALRLQQENGYLQEQAQEALRLCGGSRRALSLLHPVLKNRCLLLLIKEYTEDYVSEDISKLSMLLTAQSGKTVLLTGGIPVQAQGDGIVFYPGRTRYRLPLPLNCWVQTPMGRLYCEQVDKANIPCKGEEAYIDGDTLFGELYIRPFEEGERFTPLGMRGSKLLSDFFTDKKLPLSKRERPLVWDEKGLIYVSGFTVDQRCRLTDKTKRIYHILYRED